MRAGVRPGLQILWACLRWAGRFDSDALPPIKWTVNRLTLHCAQFTVHCFPMRPTKRKTFEKTTEVKRQARLRIGTPPAAQTHQDRRKKKAKHKKREEEQAGLESIR